jgi:hypothetical protein
MRRLSLLTLALACIALSWGTAHDPAPGVVAADPPIVVEVARPPAAKWQVFSAESGKTVRLALKDGESAVWVLAGEGTADLTPQDSLTPFVDFVGPAGRHYAVAYVKDKPVARVVIQVGPGTGPGPPPDPKDPPPPQPSSLFFVIVRPDGAATPALTNLLADPAWITLENAGHKHKDFERKVALSLGYVNPGEQLTLPCVVTIRVVGKTSTRVRGPVPVPTTAAGILDLPKGVMP